MSDRPLVFGILNVTPDSFSDGGRYLDPEVALEHALKLVEQGADYIDVGGESTRPGADSVEPGVEQDRVLPVIAALADRGVAVSIDTMHAETARAAIGAGARVVNDVSGGLADQAMADAVRGTGVRYVAMHWRGPSDRMTELAHYGDVVLEVRAELAARVEALLAAGVAREQLILDPGLGFAKTGEHNWQVLSRLDELTDLGFPLLVGASRKRFLATLPGLDQSTGPAARDLPTAVLSALLAASGVWAVRVHDVPSTVTALAVLEAWQAGGRA